MPSPLPQHSEAFSRASSGSGGYLSIESNSAFGLSSTRAKRYNSSMTRGKNANGEGSKARRRKDGRYETRAVLDTATGRRRVSFYGATAKEANERKIEALANQNKGIVFSDPKGLKVAQYLASWLSDTARYQVSEGTYERYERTCRNHLVPFFGRLTATRSDPSARTSVQSP